MSLFPWRVATRGGGAAFLIALCLLGGPVGAATMPTYSGRPPLRLPGDDAMHPRTGTEWWYVVGHLNDNQGHRYGFESVVFRFSHLRASIPSLRFDTVYRADTAVTDEARGSFSGGVRYIQPALGVTSMSAALLRLTAGPIAMARISAAPRLRYTVDETTPNGTRLHLTVQATKAPLLVGGAGIVPMGAHGYSYYYSLTRLDTQGTLWLPGQKQPRAVHGLSWMDHQWGDWDWREINGWDWMSVQLTNGMDLNITDFQGGRGSPHKAATISLPNGRQIVSTHVVMTPLGYWRSPRTHILYPSGWRVRAADVGLDLVVRPNVVDQEMADRFTPEQSYWEGSCRVGGRLRGTPISGQAYTELAGYGVPKQ